MTDEEARILAWTLLGEAGGEGLTGMEAVAHVIRNRATSGRFPANPASVALQANSRGVYQFSTWNPISNGGNIPRARYPAGSEDFNKALGIVNKVFGPTPGKDPTQGATHYYSPKGMKDGLAPYWWRSEAPKGEKRIGGHVFAIKYDPKEAPVPQKRPGGMDAPGTRGPTETELRVFRTGATEKLPVIGPRYTPTPAKQSLALQVQRENAGATVRSSQTLLYDPVKETLVPSMPTAQETKRAIGQSIIERNPPAKETQRVAGFSVKGGTAAITQIDRRRELTSQTPSYAREPLPQSKAQTQFANSTLPQANGTTGNKDESRLTTTQQKAPTLQGGPYSRDAAERIAVNNGINIVGGTPPKVAPVPKEPIQRQPVPVATPQPALRIVVQREPIVRVIAKTPVQTLRDQGYSPSGAYERANEQARERAESGGKYTSDNNSSGAVGSRSYDADTNTWR